MERNLISSKMFSRLTRFYPAKCTIQTATEVQDATGHPVATWSDFQFHVDLPCRLSPMGGGEIKSANQVYTRATHVIELTVSAPDITTKMRTVVAGQLYDILLVERDGQAASARLVVELIT